MPMSETTFEKVFDGFTKFGVEASVDGVAIVDCEQEKRVVFIENTEHYLWNRNADQFFLLGNGSFNVNTRTSPGLVIVGKEDCYAAARELITHLSTVKQHPFDHIKVDTRALKAIFVWPQTVTAKLVGCVTYQTTGTVEIGHMQTLLKQFGRAEEIKLIGRWVSKEVVAEAHRRRSQGCKTVVRYDERFGLNAAATAAATTAHSTANDK